MGRADVDALLDEVTAYQLQEWIAFFDLEPWGSEIDWLRAGTVAAQVANTIPRKAGTKAARPEDYMPRFDTDPGGARGGADGGGLDPRRIRAEMWNAFGGRIVKKKDA